ncbi:MAG TPA: hypothetical protein VGZ03_00720 [Acidimicrobiales bacterium]|jgi:hypothetical protein|nr:hypothetical protein [Acidimicrobiales bacterium]
MPDGAGGVPTDAADSPEPGRAAPAGPPKTTKEIAREALEAAGLTTPPKSTGGPRRLVLFTVVILVVLVLLVVGSLVALGHLKTKVTTPSSTPTSSPSATTTSSTTTTTGPSATLPAGVSPLTAYASASADGVVLRQVGSGGQPILLLRTTARTFITDRSAAPVVVYWWNGTCAPCAAENLVVVSALESLGGTFTGLATTTETGGFPTIDLRHARYRGPVVLEASEVDGPTGRPDQPYSAQAGAQFRALDRPPYTKIPGGYPFLDVGGHFVQVGPGFAPSLLAGQSLRTIAADLTAPNSAMTRAIDGNADVLAAAICVTLAELSRPRPAVCANPSVAAIEPALPTSAPHVAASR